MAEDIKKTLFYSKRIWAGLLLVQILLFYGLSHTPIAIDFFEYGFEWKKYPQQYFSSLFPFSLGDWGYLILGFILLRLGIKIVILKRRSFNIVRLLILLNGFYFVYQCFWGMLYFQTPIIEKLPAEEPTIAQTKRLAERYLQRCIESRLLVKEDKNGVFHITDSEALVQEILKQQHHLPTFLAPKKPTNLSDIKPSLWAPVMSYTGILGYYNPFTAEAQYNPNVPDTYLPITLAHEMAHQLGYAREEEANFIAYLVGKSSTNTVLQYSTNYFVLKSLLRDLIDTEPDFVAQILKRYSAGMKRDRAQEWAYQKRYQGPAETFFGWTNHWFLKSNQQDGAVTYSYFTRLLLRYEAAEYP